VATITSTSATTQALTQIGWLQDGASPGIPQAADGLLRAQYLIENANLQPGMWVGLSSVNFTATAATQSYTIGAAQTINIARPPKILSASALNNTLKDPVRVVQDLREWIGLTNELAQSRMPRFLFYDRGSPTGTIQIYPVPLATGTAATVTLWYPQTQANFADATTPITLLPGYGKWLIFALARDLLASYGMPMQPTIESGYQESLQAIQQLNAELFIHAEGLPPTDKGISV